MKKTYWVDPIRDSRWLDFINKHPDSSIFHTPEWLETLKKTYGYEPLVLTTSGPGIELTSGIALCRISSWLTGRRMVSLPFSDHCEPLYDNLDDLHILLHGLEQETSKKKWRYVEIRPLKKNMHEMGALGEFKISQTFLFHELNLQKSIEELWQAFHKDCVQRKIRRAEREGLKYEQGRTKSLLVAFYELQILTRKRQKLPPQPYQWFKNLMNCLGEKVTIRIAFKDGRPIAGIMTLQFKKRMVYKYGCSDAEFHNCGGMQLLYWKAIQEAKGQGLDLLDLGRSDQDNPSLVTFKERLGSYCSRLEYFCYPTESQVHFPAWIQGMGGAIIAKVPVRILSHIGKVLYKHSG